MLRIKSSSDSIDNRRQLQEYVPLKQVNVDATITSFAANVTIKQVFRNDETIPIEAVYCFPIEEQAAVYAFIARIDDREIIAQLKEKNDAQKEYSDALRQGHGAYLLEQDEKSQDNFIINVGALPPGKECCITISYVSELDLIQNGRTIRFVVPTTIAPRYNPNQGGISSPAGTTSKYVQSSPYTIEFHCQVDKIGVSRISSSSHSIQVDVGQQNVYVIEFAQQNTYLDRDILLDIDLAENRSNTIVAIEPGAVMASFTPTDEDCRRVMNNTTITNEFMFIIDCSGSMDSENKIGLARQAMILFLKSLPVHCHFNIIRFGSNYQTLFNEITAVYNEENAQKAEQLINEMRANMGGTELLKPFEWLQQHSPKQGRARQIFLLTDGEISNVSEVLDLCRSMSTFARIFSFGLGDSPSRSLVKGLARTTNGHFVFIPPKSSVDVYVGEQLQKALQSCITNVQVKWNLGTSSILSAPTKTPPVYANHRLILYALTDDQTSTFNHNSSVELYIDQHRLGEAIVDRIPNVSNTDTIARLAAKALIIEFQHAKIPEENVIGSLQTRFEHLAPSTAINDEKEMMKKRIIELSLKHQILSPYTAFVGVEKRTDASNAGMILREVPIQISADDQHLQTRHQINAYYALSMIAARRRASPSWSFDKSLLTMCKKTALSRSPSPRADALEECSSSSRKCRGTRRTKKLSGAAHRFKHSPPPADCCMMQIDSSSSPSPPRIFDSIRGSLFDAQETNVKMEKKEEEWPTDDQDVVRYLINKQKFDGVWELDGNIIEKLTGSPLTSFSSLNNNIQILISAIIIVVLETRFASYATIWHCIVQKARQRLLDLLGHDRNQLDSLLENIRQQI